MPLGRTSITKPWIRIGLPRPPRRSRPVARPGAGGGGPWTMGAAAARLSARCRSRVRPGRSPDWVPAHRALIPGRSDGTRGAGLGAVPGAPDTPAAGMKAAARLWRAGTPEADPDARFLQINAPPSFARLPGSGIPAAPGPPAQAEPVPPLRRRDGRAHLRPAPGYGLGKRPLNAQPEALTPRPPRVQFGASVSVEPQRPQQEARLPTPCYGPARPGTHTCQHYSHFALPSLTSSEPRTGKPTPRRRQCSGSPDEATSPTLCMKMYSSPPARAPCRVLLYDSGSAALRGGKPASKGLRK